MGIKDWWNRVKDSESRLNEKVRDIELDLCRYPSYNTNPELRYQYEKAFLLRGLSTFLNERKECTKYDLEQALEEFAHAAMAMENMSGVEKSAAKSIVQDQYYLARSKIFALVFCTKDMSAEAVEAFIKGLENKDE